MIWDVLIEDASRPRCPRVVAVMRSELGDTQEIAMSTENSNHENAENKVLKAEVAALHEEVEILEELIDLEEWAEAGKEPKKAKRYRLRIDKQHYVVEVHEMTGGQILGLAGKTPETYQLSQKLHGGHIEPVAADQVVKFHVHKVERFQTLALDPTEG
jgi:hypothetical protein